VTPQQVLDAIVRGLKASASFTGGDYSTQELDPSGAGNRFEQPIVTLQPTGTVRADRWNTDLVGYTTDANDNRTGRIFDAIFEMNIQLDIWVAAGNSDLDASALGGDLQRALFQFDSQMVDRAFPDGDGGTVDGITKFLVEDGRRQDDLAGPGVRRWRQELSARFRSRVTTDDEYVEEVDTPTDGEATGGDGDDVAIELTVS